MKKSFIALAVAGAVAAPITANAVDVTYSGTVGIDLYLGETASVGDTPTMENGPNIQNNDINGMVSLTEDVGFGEAFATVRLDIDSLSNGSTPTPDSIAVGLSGGFGTVTLGEGTNFAHSGQLAGDMLMDSASGGALGAPESSLTYQLPSFVGGLTIGVNLLNTTYSGGGSIPGTTEKTGLGFGASYSHDFGNAGALAVGFGTNNASTTVKNLNDAGDSVEDGNTTAAAYASMGLSYAIAGFSIAFAQQSVTGQEMTDAATDTTTEYEDMTSVDMKVGYAAGPFSASLTNSTVTNSYNGVRDEVGDDVEEGFTTTAMRIDLGYSLSDNVSVSFRNQTNKASGDSDTLQDIDSSFNRVGMTVTF